MFEIFKKKSRTASQMREARAAINVSELQAGIDSLNAKRREALLTGSDTEVRAVETDLEKARLAFDRASVAADELDKQIADAEYAEAETAFGAKYQAAIVARDAAVSRIESDYSRGANLILGVIEVVEAANGQIAEVNRELYSRDGTLADIEEADVLYWRGRYSHLKTRIKSTQLLPTHQSAPYGEPAGTLLAAHDGAWAE